MPTTEGKMPEEQGRNNPLYYYPRKYTSVSALQSFEACPISFFLRYYCGVSWPQTERMELGAKFQEALNKKYISEDYGEIIDSIDKQHRDTAKELIGKAFDFDKILSLDKEYVTDFGIGIPVKFIPDILTENEIVENKITGGYYNSNTVRHEKQGSVYYAGILKNTGKSLPVKYQLFNTKTKRCEIVMLNKSDRDIYNITDWMKKTLNGIKVCFDNDNWILDIHSRFDCGLGGACPIKYGNRIKKV